MSGCVFVAHNVGFDCAIVATDTWGASGDPKLCSARPSAPARPPSYSLGRICEGLGIGNDARHRAMGDCAATVELFHRMMA